MRTGDVLILRGAEVASLLEGKELALIEQVRAAYAAHAAGHSSLPRSIFLRFPDNDRNRIIALPSYLGQDFNVAGIKWIASFPDNLRAGLERASAVVILNSTITGQAEVILEGSLISAKRTAASAALSARTLHADAECDVVALLGCGVINFEVAKTAESVSQPLLGQMRLEGWRETLDETSDFGRFIAGSRPTDAVCAPDTAHCVFDGDACQKRRQIALDFRITQ